MSGLVRRVREWHEEVKAAHMGYAIADDSAEARVCDALVLLAELIDELEPCATDTIRCACRPHRDWSCGAPERYDLWAKRRVNRCALHTWYDDKVVPALERVLEDADD